MTTLLPRWLTWFISTLKCNFDSTSLDVVNFSVEICNVASTLIWRCSMSRHDINQKTTLKQCWNVCWVVLKCFLDKFQSNWPYLKIPFLEQTISAITIIVVVFMNKTCNCFRKRIFWIDKKKNQLSNWDFFYREFWGFCNEVLPEKPNF